MIDEKKLITEFNRKCDEYEQMCGYAQLKEDYGMDTLYAGKVLAFTEARKIVESQPKVGEWIPADTLPEDDKDVLVYFEYFRFGEYQRLFRTIGIGCTFEGRWSRLVNGQSGWWNLRIIAWMPLPEPYKGE